MKLILVICALSFGSLSLPAQTLYVPGGTAGVGASTTTNVGIGTSAPAAKLHVKGDALASTAGAVTTLLTLQNANANQNYLNVIQIRNSAGGNWNTATTRIQQVTDTASQGYIDFNPSGSTYGLAFGSNTGEVVRFLSNGNVGIGTSAPDAKLAVNGTIHAKEVIVDTSSAAWSDYVFASDYRLAPLSEVERHIKAEQHLPGIPSAAEVAARGVSVGEMQAKLLAKVEELTLYMIELEKKNAELQRTVETLKAEVRHQ